MTDDAESKPGQFYWSIDFPGLTREQAERIVAFARDELGLSGWRRGILVDPRSFYATWQDRETVETVRSGLISINQDGDVDNMIEGIDDWLRQAE